MKKKGIIELEGMEFFAFHGCLDEERRNGNTFVVDFRGKADLAEGALSDRLEDTVDYGLIYGIVEREMMQTSSLIENVAGRIVAAIERELPGFSSFSVRVSKQNPPVDGKCAWSRVTLYGGSRKKEKTL